MTYLQPALVLAYTILIVALIGILIDKIRYHWVVEAQIRKRNADD